MTAYAFFVQTCREEHKKKHPEESVIFAEFSRKCAERWKVRMKKERKERKEKKIAGLLNEKKNSLSFHKKLVHMQRRPRPTNKKKQSLKIKMGFFFFYLEFFVFVCEFAVSKNRFFFNVYHIHTSTHSPLYIICECI